MKLLIKIKIILISVGNMQNYFCFNETEKKAFIYLTKMYKNS